MGARADAMTDTPPARAEDGGTRAAAIEREIDETRAQLGLVLEAIEEQIAPRQWIGRGADMLKETLSGGAVAETLLNHPLPLALIGAGIGWLLVEATAEIRSEAPVAAEGLAYARTKIPAGDAGAELGDGEGVFARAQARLRRGVDENPLAVGLVGLLAGAALGLLLPRARAEQRVAEEPPPMDQSDAG